MDIDQIDRLLFRDFYAIPAAGFLGGLGAAAGVRLLFPEIKGTKPLWKIIISAILRAFVGGAIVFALLVLALLSAMPFSGTISGLPQSFRIAVVFCPFWAAFAVVNLRSASKRKEAEELEHKHQPIEKWKGLAGAVLACLSASLTIRAYSFIPPPPPEDIKARAEAERHMQAAAQCEGELRQIEDEYIVESLLLDTNFSEIDTIKHLLGDSGIRFVELKASKFKRLYDKKELLGAQLLHGGEGKTYEVSPDTKYLRFELSKTGDPHCDTSSYNPLDIKLRSPFAPDACIRVTTDQKSLASHAIKALPATDGTDFIRWTLLEQSSGKALVALTSSDRPDSPEGRRSGGKSRSVKHGNISCEGPYFTLPQALGGIPGHANPPLSLVRRRIEPRLVDLNSDSVIWSEINVDAPEVSKDKIPGIEDTASWGEGWRTAYTKAQRSGFASTDRELIDYKAGELLSLGTLKFKEELHYPHTAASKHGFAILFNPGSGMHLARFSLNGELEWQGIIRINGDSDPASRQPSIESIRWEEEKIRIYLVKFKENSPSYQLLTVPNSLMGIKQGSLKSEAKHLSHR